METKKNTVISCLFYPSLVLLVRYSVYGKKGKTVTSSRRLQAKDEMCTLQSGKRCYNAININCVLLLLYVQSCKRAQFLVCRGPSYVKEFAVFSYHWSYAQLCMLTQGKWTRYESYIIILRDRTGVGFKLKVSNKVCGFTFGSISLNLISKRIKETLTQKHQYNAKKFSHPEIFFSRFQLYAQAYVRTCTLQSW